ncbi:MAG: WecB/TagA/CpsF family glycosyltransferase [Pseudomonadota bacterium]
MAVLEAVTVPSQADLLADLRDHMTRGQGFAVATMNLDHVVKLRKDPDFRSAYGAHTHVTADGRPIVWLSRLAGRPISLVTGSDLVSPLVALCADLGVSVAIVGSTDEALRDAAKKLRQQHRGLVFAKLISPPMGFDPLGEGADAVVEQLAASGAQVCLLALGAPKQEIFSAKAFQELPGMGFVSVGAGIDFIAGMQSRAPRLMRSLALEWLWRLAGSPRRLFRRYISCAAILPALFRNAMALRAADGAKIT